MSYINNVRSLCSRQSAIGRQYCY